VLRGEIDTKKTRIGWLLALAVGIGCGALVLLGNPGNMGICGACFLRDSAGALRLYGEPEGTHYLRPEVVGIIFGALLLALARGSFVARSGSHAITRLFFGAWMAIGSLVFLGCPFRMLQRLGGGDLNAWVGLLGLIGGVGIGLAFEKRGYSVGKTRESPTVLGLLGPMIFLAAFGLSALRLLDGPGISGETPPAHAPWLASLSIALLAGAALSVTRFCAITAARQVFMKDRRMIFAAGALIIGYGVVVFASGNGNLGFEGQPAAHSESLWNILSLALVGLCGCLCGGCPVRQMVMTGEGNGDAAVTVMGILFGGALCHNLGLISSSAGTTSAGQTAVVIGLVLAVGYGFLRSRSGAGA